MTKPKYGFKFIKKIHRKRPDRHSKNLNKHKKLQQKKK